MSSNTTFVITLNGDNCTLNKNSNKIITTKYTFYNFLPKNLLFQFSNVANIYFFLLIVLQAEPTFSQNIPLIVVSTPLLIILLAVALKDAAEDWKRFQQDSVVNSYDTYVCVGQLFRRKTLVNLPEEIQLTDYLDIDSKETEKDYHNRFSWQKTKWQDIKIGEFVLLRNNDAIPADLVIISTSEPSASCYIETKNLDGETNLKVRNGIPQLSCIQTPFDCATMRGTLELENPDAHMYSFHGVANIDTSVLSSEKEHFKESLPVKVPLSINSVLLRGCFIRNTKWVIGVVVGIGADTKLMLNSGKTPTKKSRIDRQLNPQILLNFMILFTMCLACGVLGAIYQIAFNFVSNSSGEFINKPNFLETDPLKIILPIAEPTFIALLTFASCLIIFQNIIPIAIYISVDVAKTFNSYLIYRDQDMVDPATDLPCVPRSWNLCDDLGQIEYIFSDKTGTLTCNVMEFRKCSINGVVYGNGFISQANVGLLKRNGDGKCGNLEKNYSSNRLKEETEMRDTMSNLFDTRYVKADALSFVDLELHNDINLGLQSKVKNDEINETTEHAKAIIEFFTLLAVCHTVLVEYPDPDNHDNLSYAAQSPDEAALVAAARDCGFTFLRREDDLIFVDVMGTEKSFQILNVLEFNSDRKRMSVLVRKPGQKDVLLLCKGADSIIFEMLTKTEEKLLRSTTNHLETFANDGLRTLCLAYRIIPEAEYEKWAVEYAEALNSVESHDENVDALSASIECNLTLMGATAIEDKLQDGVPESIALLSKAGIKIWVLTGDKMETAINIGFACNLLSRDMLLIVVKSTKNVEETLKQIKDALTLFWSPDGTPIKRESHALIIDGDTLNFALDTECKDFLLELSCRCKAVICCRVSPKQKAQVVTLVRNGLSAMCLAIGDGANDVSMIQAADVGIGISGLEGMQAVMSSDYSIGQFRFLSRLLLVHGRWAYLRTAELVLNYFYKNVVWLFVLFWYQFDSAFTGDIITDYTYGMFFNTVFSLLPNMVLGMLDQDVNDQISLQVPELYQIGIQQKLYNMEKFWFYIFDAIYQSVVIYFMGVFVFSDSVINPDGLSPSKQEFGTYLSFYIICTVNLYMGFNIVNWTWITHTALWSTLLVFFGYVAVYLNFIAIYMPGVYDTTYLPNVFYMPMFYLSLILALTLSLFPRFLFKFSQQYFYPTDIDIVQEYQSYIWKDGDVVNLDIKHSDKNSSLKESDQSSVQTENEPNTDDLDSNSNFLRRKHNKKSSATSAVSSTQLPSITIDSPVETILRRQPRLIPSSMFFSSTSNCEHDSFENEADELPNTSNITNPPKSPKMLLHERIITPLTEFNKKTVEFVKSVPRLLRIPSLTPSWRLNPYGENRSMVFMGGEPVGREVPNTGFAFSHGEGMGQQIMGRSATLYSTTSYGERFDPPILVETDGCATPIKSVKKDDLTHENNFEGLRSRQLQQVKIDINLSPSIDISLNSPPPNDKHSSSHLL
ncbi:hypothetical protein HDU92_003332 [Lobulomyces angularis]|nr:hypothetical protein HDU92_003332 [Lobulomyces angularis]